MYKRQGLALIGGIGLGIGIERVLYALLSMMAQGTLPLGVYIGIGSIRSTCLLFVVIFMLIFLNSIRPIHLADPIELLHGSLLYTSIITGIWARERSISSPHSG